MLLLSSWVIQSVSPSQLTDWRKIQQRNKYMGYDLVWLEEVRQAIISWFALHCTSKSNEGITENNVHVCLHACRIEYHATLTQVKDGRRDGCSSGKKGRMKPIGIFISVNEWRTSAVAVAPPPPAWDDVYRNRKCYTNHLWVSVCILLFEKHLLLWE